MAPRDASQPKTPQERLEDLVSHKKHVLLEDTQTPPRIKNLLIQKRDPKCTAEIIGHIVFPECSQKTKDHLKSQAFLRSVLLGNKGRDDEFHKLKTKIQHAEHLTDRTRIAVLNVLDDLHG